MPRGRSQAPPGPGSTSAGQHDRLSSPGTSITLGEQQLDVAVRRWTTADTAVDATLGSGPPSQVVREPSRRARTCAAASTTRARPAIGSGGQTTATSWASRGFGVGGLAEAEGRSAHEISRSAIPCGTQFRSGSVRAPGRGGRPPDYVGSNRSVRATCQGDGGEAALLLDPAGGGRRRQSVSRPDRPVPVRRRGPTKEAWPASSRSLPSRVVWQHRPKPPSQASPVGRIRMAPPPWFAVARAPPWWWRPKMRRKRRLDHSGDSLTTSHPSPLAAWMRVMTLDRIGTGSGPPQIQSPALSSTAASRPRENPEDGRSEVASG